MVKPKIIQGAQMLLLGFSFFGNPFEISTGWTEENEIGRLWNRFMVYLAHHPGLFQHVKDKTVMYEVHIQHPETDRTGEYEVFVGLEVTQLKDVPVQVSLKILPVTTYAVFTLRGAQITSDWNKLIYSDWMSQSGYRSAYPFGFQRYDARFKGLDQIDESVLEVYVPVIR